MLGNAMKNVLLGNVQLLDYCNKQGIDISELSKCNIERMGSKYYFVLPKPGIRPTMDNDRASQPDVVLTMDAHTDRFKFEQTVWTEKVALPG